MKTISSMLLALTGLAVAMANEIEPPHNFKPKDGFVPNSQTAITIAVAVWIPIYGKEKIEDEKPYKTTLSNGTWTVQGSLPRNMLGGVAIAEISKEDGTIIRVSHGK